MRVQLLCFAESDARDHAAALPADGGASWLAWPQQSADVPTEVTQDIVRALGLATGLVDTKACAIDAASASRPRGATRTRRASPRACARRGPAPRSTGAHGVDRA